MTAQTMINGSHTFADPTPVSPGGIVPDLAAVGVLRREMQSRGDPAELLRQAPLDACRWTGFERAVVATLRDGRLVAASSHACGDRGCDSLRMQLLDHPVTCGSRSLECEAARSGRTMGGKNVASRSVLARTLELQHAVLAPVQIDTHVVGFVAVDRAATPTESCHDEAMAVFAEVLGAVLEALLVRGRLKEVSAELRHLTTSAQALIAEAEQAPAVLPVDRGHGPMFPGTLLSAIPSDGVTWLLTERERAIMDHVAEGRSNPEIGAALMISVDTVKAHIARTLKKMGAANRAEAAALYVRGR